MFSLSGVYGKSLVGLERDEDPSGDVILTCRKSAVGNDAVAVRRFVLQFLVNLLSNTRVVPATGTVCA